MHTEEFLSPSFLIGHGGSENNYANNTASMKKVIHVY